MYLGHSPFHAGSVALVFNPCTGHVSPQYHVVFDNTFSTVPFMDNGTVPPHLADLHKHSTERATNEEFNLAEVGGPELEFSSSVTFFPIFGLTAVLKILSFPALASGDNIAN